MAGSAEYYSAHEKVRHERRAALERLFHAELGRAKVEGDWIYPPTNARIFAVPRRGRTADLLIAGQGDPQDPEAYVGDRRYPEDLLMATGRPVLMIPYVGAFPSLGSEVMVAWDGSREATRAVHDALPFMQRAKRTTIITVNGRKDEPADSRPAGTDIAAVIARHGVKVEVINIDEVGGASIGDALLCHASDLGADLIVMGAYGHARWQERVMGGADPGNSKIDDAAGADVALANEPESRNPRDLCNPAAFCIRRVVHSGSAALPDQIIEHRYRRSCQQDRREGDRGDEANLLEAEGANQPAGKEHPEQRRKQPQPPAVRPDLAFPSVTAPKFQ